MIITPEELYYLGTLMQARYIDYAYVAGMNDISQKRALYEKETAASLVKKGLLMEDFSGETEIDGEAEALLRPVFFGETETSVDMIDAGTGETAVNKYHFLDGKAVSVTVVPSGLMICPTGSDSIKETISSLLPDKTAPFEKKVISDLPKEKVDRIYAFRRMEVGKASECFYAVLSEGELYCSSDDGGIETVSAAEMVRMAYETVRGEL